MKNEELNTEIAASKSTFELLFRASRRINDYALYSLYQKTGVPFRPSHTAMLPHINAEGVRASEIAKKLGISKQAVSKRINELVEFGTVERIPDPTDGRAMLVRFNSLSILEGLQHLNVVEEEFSDSVGRREMDALAETLQALLDYLDTLAPKDKEIL